MKIKQFLCIALLALLTFNIGPVLAEKPSNNQAGAQNIAWQSDEASKLMVNQPNGAVEAILNGVMKGLRPNTEYTVYISKGYTQAVIVSNQWIITGTWDFDCVGYTHRYTIVQSGSNFEGIGGSPAAAFTTYEKVSGTIEPLTGQVTMTEVSYSDNAPTVPTGYSYTAALTIDPIDGSMDGHLTGSQAGLPFVSTSGAATRSTQGNGGWPGLLLATVQPFTFNTNKQGHANWHLNLRDTDFNEPGTYEMSVWINSAGANVLISDTFAVVVD